MATSLAIQLLQIHTQITRYEFPFILVFGCVTNLINMMIFSRRVLRQNVCSWYFICLSLLQFLLLITMCLQTIVITYTGYNITAHLVSFCKIRQYAFDLITSLIRHFLCLISIDRWMVTSSSAWLRRQSSPRVARWVVIFSVIFWSIFNIHSAIEYNIFSNLCTAPLPSSYFLFYSIYNIIISVFPMIIMILFSVLTLRNLRVKRVIPIHPMNSVGVNATSTITNVNQPVSRQRSQRDIHLIRLSIIQVAAFVIFNSGWCVYPLYLFVTTARGNRTLEERLLSAFLVAFGFNLLYVYAAVCLIVQN